MSIKLRLASKIYLKIRFREIQERNGANLFSTFKKITILEWSISLFWSISLISELDIFFDKEIMISFAANECRSEHPSVRYL